MRRAGELVACVVAAAGVAVAAAGAGVDHAGVCLVGLLAAFVFGAFVAPTRRL